MPSRGRSRTQCWRLERCCINSQGVASDLAETPHGSNSEQYGMTATSKESRLYLALGDSMSIDEYTGVPGGGAVSQLYTWLKGLGQSWALDDRTADMCRMRYVPASVTGNLITLTIGGNDLLADQQRYLKDGLSSFAQEHLNLLTRLRADNPDALLIVGNIYAPRHRWRIN